jgi:two-component system, OmpR family, response regulator
LDLSLRIPILPSRFSSAEHRAQMYQGCVDARPLLRVRASAARTDTLRYKKIAPACWRSGKNSPMERADHILIVDDDLEIRGLLREYLEKNGFRVTLAADGRQMRTALAAGSFDLIVLDLMLPGEDGLALCRHLRAGAPESVPVLILTARSEETDRIVGLEMGADDYLTKPFSARELLARIIAVLRRTRMLPPNLREAQEAARMLSFGAWSLDTTERHLIDAAGTMVSLSGAEYRLLRVFLRHPQHVLSREQLLDLTQGRGTDVFDRSIDLLVSRLRQRLRDEAREPRYIKTVRNEGYVFAAAVTPRAEVP